MARNLLTRLGLATGYVAVAVGGAMLAGCPPMPPIGPMGDPPAGLPGSIAQFGDMAVPDEDAATDLESQVFGMSRSRGVEPALDELDLALSNSLQTAADLEALAARSLSLSGRIVRPDEAADRYEITETARVRQVDYETARKMFQQERFAKQTPQELCPQDKVTFIHVNGVNVIYPEFLANVAALKNFVDNIVGLPDAEVIGVYQVSASDSERSFIGVLCSLLTYPGRLVASREALQTLCRLPGFAVDTGQSVEQRIADFLGDPLISGRFGNVNAIRTAIERAVQSGRVVIVCPHSQGNFFARDAVNALGSDDEGSFKDSVAVVQFASPTNGMPSPTERIDVCSDLVPLLSTEFNPLNAAFCSTAPAAFSTFPGSHSFIDSYLSLEGAGTRASLALQRFLPTGSQPLINLRTPLGFGIIQATMTWNTSADIDLHVYEPPAPGSGADSGDHVYFGHKIGQSGVLDRDDTDGRGPENYYVCSVGDLHPGVYRIEAHHFSGASPTDGTIRIRAGSVDQVFGFNVSDENPIDRVINVTVSDRGFVTVNPG